MPFKKVNIKLKKELLKNQTLENTHQKTIAILKGY